MPIELSLLVWSAVLCVALALPYTVGLTLKLGLPRMAGNREDMPPEEGWIGRAHRAHANMVENLIPFAALVLVAQATGHLNATTALGAQLFFWARLVHAGSYLAGIPWIRTAAFLVSLIGMVLILSQLWG